MKKDYPNETVSDDILLEIAQNCRFTPRIGLSLLKEYIYIRDWQQVKKNNNIVTDGLTRNDIRILKYINDVDGAGKGTLAKFLRVEPKTYEFEIEPYLMFKELIVVANKRKLTPKGKELIQCL
jgi:Holliday junction resolvasome RuvABC ATP-dependent DNA helicase subunit